jgi:prepilin-type N-terminal cleavage/methylation domain-containing protein
MTLVELAVVLAILGILAGAAVPMARVYFQNAVRDRIDERLNEAAVALTAYWGSHGALPCPDADGDGSGDCSSGSGARLTGLLPHADLGLPPNDGAGRPLTYVVLRQLTEHTSVTATIRAGRCEALAALSSSTDLRVQDNGATVSVPFVLVSGGPENRDGAGGYLDGENADGNDGLYQRKPPDTTFDDVTAYVSAYALWRSGCGTLVVQNAAGGTFTGSLQVDQSFDSGTSWTNLASVPDGTSSAILQIEAGSWIRVVDASSAATVDQFAFTSGPASLRYDTP